MVRVAQMVADAMRSVAYHRLRFQVLREAVLYSTRPGFVKPGGSGQGSL
jgi:hypothetical protein